MFTSLICNPFFGGFLRCCQALSFLTLILEIVRAHSFTFFLPRTVNPWYERVSRTAAEHIHAMAIGCMEEGALYQECCAALPVVANPFSDIYLGTVSRTAARPSCTPTCGCHCCAPCAGLHLLLQLSYTGMLLTSAHPAPPDLPHCLSSSCHWCMAAKRAPQLCGMRPTLSASPVTDPWTPQGLQRAWLGGPAGELGRWQPSDICAASTSHGSPSARAPPGSPSGGSCAARLRTLSTH